MRHFFYGANHKLIHSFPPSKVQMIPYNNASRNFKEKDKKYINLGPTQPLFFTTNNIKKVFYYRLMI